ncbi:MAG TPA: hypothetical protein VG167_10160 [Verrucomicrobiae bacterium]|nr:hypothetical protein [Verrucomicrobiae bacterium]
MRSCVRVASNLAQPGRCLEGRRRQESLKADWRAGERGWFLGDPQLKEELLAQMHERRQDHYGPELRQADQVHAERVLREELSRRGWTEAELSRRRKGDPEKVALAGQLRAHDHDLEMDRPTA